MPGINDEVSTSTETSFASTPAQSTFNSDLGRAMLALRTNDFTDSFLNPRLVNGLSFAPLASQSPTPRRRRRQPANGAQTRREPSLSARYDTPEVRDFDSPAIQPISPKVNTFKDFFRKHASTASSTSEDNLSPPSERKSAKVRPQSNPGTMLSELPSRRLTTSQDRVWGRPIFSNNF